MTHDPKSDLRRETPGLWSKFAAPVHNSPEIPPENAPNPPKTGGDVENISPKAPLFRPKPVPVRPKPVRTRPGPVRTGGPIPRAGSGPPSHSALMDIYGYSMGDRQRRVPKKGKRMKRLKTLASILTVCLLLNPSALALEETEAFPPEEEKPVSLTGEGAAGEAPKLEKSPETEEAPEAGEDAEPAARTPGLTANVHDSDAFREAVADGSVGEIVFHGQVVVEYLEDGDNDLDAGTKIIRPANPDSDEDNLLFERGVTLLHVSRHEGNTEDPDSQSVRMIYGRDYTEGHPDYALLMEAAQGWLGWYEYHDPDNRNDGDAGYRLCYMLYCGGWQDAADAAEDLTAGGWFHPRSGPADENQIIFLQFGANYHGAEGDVVIDRDILVTGYTELLGGQNLTVTSGATLTTGGLTLQDVTEDWDYSYKGPGKSGLYVNEGSRVTIKRWEGEDNRDDGAYIDRAFLGAEGEVRIEDLESGLTYEEDADIWCEYRPFLLTPEPLTEDGPAGACWDAPNAADSLPLEDGYAGGFLYAAWFGRRELEDGSLGPAGWWFDQEGAETAVVTDENGKPSGGLILDWTEVDGQAGLTAVSPGLYLIYRYHDPDRWEEWGWEDGWIPNENGTDAFGTDIPGAEGLPIRVQVESVPKRSAGLEEREDGTVLAWPELPRRALDRTARAFAVSGEGGPLAGEVNSGEGWVSFAGRPEPGWGLILVDGDFRPVCGKLEITE